MSFKDSAAQVELLISAPYLVAAEADLDRALAKLRSAKFEFVLMDIDVTGAAGEKFIETLRADETLASLPVLVTSRSDDMAAIERCIERGADDYLPKTFGPAVLRVRVAAALDRRRIR